MSPEELPVGWTYDGIVRSSNPIMGGTQVLQATRVFPREFGSVMVRAQASTLEDLITEAETMEKVLCSYNNVRDSQDILVSRREFSKILNDNIHQVDQITSLQKDLRLKESHLRVHRTVSLSSDQVAVLKKRLEEATNEVLLDYAPKPEAPPKTKSGEFILSCPSCANTAYATPSTVPPKPTG